MLLKSLFKTSLSCRLPSVNLGELAMKYENSYQDDGIHEEGRDERMSYGKEMKRFASYQGGLLPRARSTGILLISYITSSKYDPFLV